MLDLPSLLNYEGYEGLYAFVLQTGVKKKERR
jgi:hypothetical protein